MSKEANYNSSWPLWALFLIFTTAKLWGQISWSWWWVTAPLWGPLALVLVVLMIYSGYKLIAEMIK